MNINKSLIAVVVLLASAFSGFSQKLPSDIYVEGGSKHVQGIVFDKTAEKLYLSFTTSFLKTDLEGNVIGSIEKIQGHLGAMTFNPEDRKVYASLECKDDAIGASLSSFAKGKSMFYVAIIDVDKLNTVGMSSEDNEIFKIVCIREAGTDYHAVEMLGGREVEHRYACSGIDGVTIAPKLGKKGGKNYLYAAYGVYGDKERGDNDHQVLLRYDIDELNEYAGTVKFGDFYSAGPDKPEDKYFIFTGNTNWGVQNMAYDDASGKMFLAVYKGGKPAFENYDLFTFDVAEKPVKRMLEGVSYDTGRHPVIGSSAAPVEGWRFKWGSTGLCPIGDGLFYISESGKSKESGRQYCNAHLYFWTGEKDKPFERR